MIKVLIIDVENLKMLHLYPCCVKLDSYFIVVNICCKLFSSNLEERLQ